MEAPQANIDKYLPGCAEQLLIWANNNQFSIPEYEREAARYEELHDMPLPFAYWVYPPSLPAARDVLKQMTQDDMENFYAYLIRETNDLQNAIVAANGMFFRRKDDLV